MCKWKFIIEFFWYDIRFINGIKNNGFNVKGMRDINLLWLFFILRNEGLG